MLKTRIIPTLLMKDVGLVKGVGFNSWRRVGSVLPSIKVYNLRQVDELIVLDISASPAGRGPDFEEIRSFSPDCFVPLTVGGGVKTIEDMVKLLRAGADKIALNSICYEKPGLINEAVSRFGTQCIVASIDARMEAPGKYVCYSHSGNKKQDVSPSEWARELESRGAGEILITSIERDGAMNGYDLELISSITNAVKIPVIASGGASSYDDFYLAITQAKAQAVSAASIFHFTEKTPLEAKQFLSEKRIAVTRMPPRERL